MKIANIIVFILILLFVGSFIAIIIRTGYRFIRDLKKKGFFYSFFTNMIFTRGFGFIVVSVGGVLIFVKWILPANPIIAIAVIVIFLPIYIKLLWWILTGEEYDTSDLEESLSVFTEKRIYRDTSNNKENQSGSITRITCDEQDIEVKGTKGPSLYFDGMTYVTAVRQTSNGKIYDLYNKNTGLEKCSIRVGSYNIPSNKAELLTNNGHTITIIDKPNGIY